ncbi:MAG TPA: hypothetical protein VEC01_17110 [Noviherbaspirillum sp.]|uniref:hypothetical protein n=1 Tax=Noviherbaspirillum sp. TaxID=1926288 RepID=UPI002D375DAF|nr:hypothetical protein [Noviherbaspirillum sp.]HYD97051.1 hypothetical protein [Noviherbaspirillum sp.]
MLQSMLLCVALMQGLPMAHAFDAFSFGVVAHALPRTDVDSNLGNTIKETDAENLAFVVVHGLKAGREPCTDNLYQQRKEVLQDSQHALILSLTASDWAECRTEVGKSDALAKLNRLRDLYFADSFSLGADKIALARQSTIAKFRGFAENARWTIDGIMFATVNLPSDNNHYLPDAGRNSEFEDRLVANRNWLNRVFTLAQQGKFKAVVLFSDANPLSAPNAQGRDGFAETRKLILGLATKFPGKVLLVHASGGQDNTGPRIYWQGNLGELLAAPAWMKVTVKPSGPALFTLEPFPQQVENRHR